MTRRRLHPDGQDDTAREVGVHHLLEDVHPEAVCRLHVPRVTRVRVRQPRLVEIPHVAFDVAHEQAGTAGHGRVAECEPPGETEVLLRPDELAGLQCAE